MKTPTRITILSLLAAAGFATGAGQAMAKRFSPLDAGMLVTNTDGDRSIAIGATTRSVNVVNGETVTFTVNGARFTYAFNAWDTIGAIDLAAIAPKGVDVPHIRVYIAPNPFSRG